MDGLIASAKPKPPPSYEDSLFQILRKDQRVSRIIALSITDFSDGQLLDEANQLNQQFPIGGFLLNNGDIIAIEQWIKKIKSTSVLVPVFGLRLEHPFSLPLDGIGNPASEQQLQSMTDASLLFQLGQLTGQKLRHAGFDVLVLNRYSEDFLENSYLSGLRTANLSIVIESSQNMFVERDFKSDTALFTGIFDNTIDPSLKDIKPKSWKKKFRSSSKYQGLIWSNVSIENPLEIKALTNKINMGADIAVLSMESGSTSTLLNTLKKGKYIKSKILSKKVKRMISYLQPNQALDNGHSASLQSLNYAKLSHQIHTGSVGLFKNDEALLPLKNLDRIEIATITEDDHQGEVLRKYINFYTRTTRYDLDKILRNQGSTLESLTHFDHTVIHLSEEQLRHNGELLISVMEKLSNSTKLIILYSGSIKLLQQLDRFSTILWTPHYTTYYAGILPQSLFSAEPITARLTTTVQESGTQLSIPALGRLKYAPATTELIDENRLRLVDMVVKDAIETGAMPGCQILIAKSGTVLFNKAYGYLTYDSLIKVSDKSLYDIASITKVVATVPSLMFLEDWDKISVDKSLAEADLYYAGTDKADIKIKDLLLHQAGLQSHLPFWRNAQSSPQSDDFLFKVPRRKRRRHHQKLMNVEWNDSIKHWIVESKLIKKDEWTGEYPYFYSDLGFMLLKDLTETKLNQEIDIFLRQNLLDPMGMTNTHYHPLCQFPIDKIAPTEDDDYFRNTLVWGTVHDQNAAVSGGVAGHAGLFSNANDLAKYMQMLLQKGTYGGQQFFHPKTVDLFTRRHSAENRRGLGWDKPDFNVGNSSKYSSPDSFGHTGFTGTSVWADPEHELIYVFLSNRIYPNIRNTKLIENNIRTTIQDLMYESLTKIEQIKTN